MGRDFEIRNQKAHKKEKGTKMQEKYFHELKTGCLYFNRITNSYIFLIRNDKEKTIMFDLTSKELLICNSFLETVSDPTRGIALRIISEWIALKTLLEIIKKNDIIFGVWKRRR